MYFILVIFSFLTICLSAVGLTQVVTANGWHEFTIGLAVVSGIATTITTFAMMFQNMYFRNRIVKEINEMRKYVKRIAEKKLDLARYKEEFKQVLTEMYPQYEKEMFSKMAQQDAKQLEVMLVKYPELKFDGVLTGYVDGIKARLKNINDYEYCIQSCVQDINDLNDDGWMLKRVVLPTDVQTIMDK